MLPPEHLEISQFHIGLCVTYSVLSLRLAVQVDLDKRNASARDVTYCTSYNLLSMKKSLASISKFLSYTSRNFSIADTCKQLGYGIADIERYKYKLISE
jgi:hypothetical protein